MLRKYSQRTIKLYLYQNREFLEFSKKNPCEVSNEDMRDYLYHLANDKEVLERIWAIKMVISEPG